LDRFPRQELFRRWDLAAEGKKGILVAIVGRTSSEKAIRNMKVKTKVSGQFRNKAGKGADRYAKTRSVIDTTIKNGQDVYTALFCLANGQVRTT